MNTTVAKIIKKFKSDPPGMYRLAKLNINIININKNIVVKNKV